MFSSLAAEQEFESTGIAASHICSERIWRRPEMDEPGAGNSDGRITLARWTTADGPVVDTGTTCLQDCYVVGVSLRSTRVLFQQEGKRLFEGQLRSGMFQVTCPGVSARAVFSAGCDVLHLLTPASVLNAVSMEAFDGLDVDLSLRRRPEIAGDACIERLANALVLADGSFRAYGQLYMDSVSIALISRLLDLSVRPHAQALWTRQAGLPKWRLQRVVDFIEANLARPIGLEDLANAAGLTRMHFASQFRLATGLRPHEYLMRRRIEFSQALLAAGDLSLLDAALRAGFQTQAHFTTVFKRVVGTTPKCWRDEARIRSA
ncbi:helix-turn-helix domain-containing protein [Paraburkholderia unamae]|uniref:AraC-like DNA-binding protein n=1 Tax=Paraburkholderia unamae TaxID=219649 RepID=A0ABX5KVC3_9BURK|nr:AraC family transcriptional regulator [Paraburkholderia unamae]PVX85921.1 AraC-like DNA-binding protein [Paraburkholderia unamae]